MIGDFSSSFGQSYYKMCSLQLYNCTKNTDFLSLVIDPLKKHSKCRRNFLPVHRHFLVHTFTTCTQTLFSSEFTTCIKPLFSSDIYYLYIGIVYFRHLLPVDIVSTEIYCLQTFLVQTFNNCKHCLLQTFTTCRNYLFRTFTSCRHCLLQTFTT